MYIKTGFPEIGNKKFKDFSRTFFPVFSSTWHFQIVTNEQTTVTLDPLSHVVKINSTYRIQAIDNVKQFL